MRIRSRGSGPTPAEPTPRSYPSVVARLEIPFIRPRRCSVWARYESDNQLPIAADTYRRVLQLVGDPPQGLASQAHLALARISFEWNELEAAQRHAQQAIQRSRQMDSVEIVASCLVFLTPLRLAQDDVASAVAALDKAEAFVRQHNFLFRLPDVAAARMLTLLRQGHVAEAGLVAGTYDLPISRAGVHVAEGETSAALALLEAWRAHVEAKGWADERLKAMIVQAVALQAHGDRDQAVHVLDDALALAQPGAFVRSFVDEGTPMADLLAVAAAQARIPDYAAKLLAAFEVDKPKSHNESAQRLTEPLTHRALEVLRLITQGLSNHEIGERLFLALDTVKGHNRTIFGKLQVQRRTEAVARARELGLA
jgi:LuxR family transcriptional regulator, maltose regulon positive regulatory protein